MDNLALAARPAELALGDPRRLLAPSPPLPPPLAADGRLPPSLPLRARLLVEAALPQFGVQARALHLALEPAKGPLEALVFLDDDFQFGPPRRLGTLQCADSPLLRHPWRHGQEPASGSRPPLGTGAAHAQGMIGEAPCGDKSGVRLRRRPSCARRRAGRLRRGYRGSLRPRPAPAWPEHGTRDGRRIPAGWWYTWPRRECRVGARPTCPAFPWSRAQSR